MKKKKTPNESNVIHINFVQIQVIYNTKRHFKHFEFISRNVWHYLYPIKKKKNYAY